MSGTTKFESAQDARQQLDGVADWEFGEDASFDDLCRWAYHHGDDHPDTDSVIASYLMSRGHSPADYGLRQASPMDIICAVIIYGGDPQIVIDLARRHQDLPVG